ncbi:MAG: hypothetical protein R3C68_00495 [Myxococcota bacterium]
MSFHCYIEEARFGTEQRIHTFEYNGHPFRAEELRVPATPPQARLDFERYGHLASLLAPGFHYGGFLSSEALDLEPVGDSIANAFSYPNFTLARLDFLASTDIFLGHTWVLDRDDLMEVYPYHVHLRNLVRVFRKRYHHVRGRL